VSLRVGFVLGTTAGGAGRHAAMLAGACADAGALVRVFGPASTGALLAPGRTDVIGFDEVGITDRPRPAGDARAVFRLRRLLAAMQPDVVHAHGLRAGAFAALALSLGEWRPSRGQRPALVVTVHNAPPSRARLAAIYLLLERLVARRAEVVLCVSPDLSDRMRKRGARDVRRAVVAAAMSPDQPPAELDADGRPVVLGVGRLAPQKGFGTLLGAAGRWRARQPVPLVVIAGSGPLAGDLARQARELEADARFLGARDDVAGLLAAADVFVLPSLWEGQPLILQEALRAGRPIVAADVGGVRDLTGDDAALLVPASDSAALSQAVLAVLDEPELAAKLAKAALSRAASLPSEADAAAAALGLYGQLARQRDGPSSG
jgi:glycosyltransferase involved in cell wall biosynthesis